MKKCFLSYTFLILFCFTLSAQKTPVKELFIPVCDAITDYFGDRFVAKDTLRVQNVYINKGGGAEIQFSNYLCDAPLRKNDVKAIYDIVKANMPEEYARYRTNFKIYSNESLLDELPSGALPVDYALASDPPLARSTANAVGKNAFEPSKIPLVTRTTSLNKPSKGLNGRHIALWQSHGYYYAPSVDKWIWQRPQLFGTVEDLYTQSYVLPFLVPMLENAGANVLLPRERDVQTNELIVDNDDLSESGALYVEKNGKNKWSKGSERGFAPYSTLVHGQDPFTFGTYRIARCVTGKEEPSVIYWNAAVPESGEYAVYVSYGKVDNATTAAEYLINHTGGASTFSVNQTMGAGTWVYLGTFGFDKDAQSQGVYLTNSSNSSGKNVSADAVKFGGGQGVVARGNNNVTSGAPKFTEGATYWLHSAGFEEDVYNESKSKDDYRNDYMSRGLWVNSLAGGSSRLPKEKGLGIPVDLAFALHSDAGITKQDSIIGTLSIYRRLSDGSRSYSYGGPRLTAREYADLVQTQIVSDVRTKYQMNWTRRELWDRSYLEARLPEVPTAMIELLSHQNFSDMVMGLDPEFRFDVSRAIYKGILKYISYLNNRSYVVQPLPVKDFEIDADFAYTNMVTLTWQPTMDSLDKTAVPEGYIVYTRVLDSDKVGQEDMQPGYGHYGFDEGVKVLSNSYYKKIEPGKIYSFKVTAVNSGGESFPSEVLSVGMIAPSLSSDSSKIELKNNKPTILIVNNYNRLSGPAYFGLKDTTMAGFAYHLDSGSPYQRDINYIGPMMEFRRDEEYLSDEKPGFGASETTFANTVIAGNTFDFPLIHGAAIMESGYNFVSRSASSISGQNIDTKKYPILDLICGKQVRTPKGPQRIEYQVFPDYLINALTTYSESGGNILVSGSYVGTDSNENIYDFTSIYDLGKVSKEQEKERDFCEKILKFKWVSNKTGIDGILTPVNSLGKRLPALDFHTTPNSIRYCVESPDAIKPVGLQAHAFLRYNDGKSNAGIYFKSNKYKAVTLGFPIETLKTQQQINSLFSSILSFLTE
ncbi:MAG: xanthan lyase [Bacteroidales bacterium]|nr:xanthan lyase [Bacteroidales bacterium]